MHDSCHKVNTAPVPEAVLYLRSILLVLELVSLTLCQQYATTASYTLIKLLQSLLDNVNFQIEHTSPAMLAEKGYSTSYDNASETLQLVEKIGGTVLALLNSSTSHSASHISCCCVLKCILRPQWGLVAAAIRSKMLKSGRVPSRAWPACVQNLAEPGLLTVMISGAVQCITSGVIFTSTSANLLLQAGCHGCWLV